MLDGSVTPFQVRSSITIASLKAKFEPWQPMKGRALLHHDVQLDNRATLGSIPGIKNGTVLRVDKHVSQVRNRTTWKKSVMSGPASSVVDEDVLESIETSENDEETSRQDERRISSSKRKRPSRTSEATVEDLIEDDNIADSLQGSMMLASEMSGSHLTMTDTNLSNSAMAQHAVKRERRETPARRQAAAPEVQRLSYRPHPLTIMSAPFQENSAGTHWPKSIAAVSSRRNSAEDDDATFLAGLNAAALEMETPPLDPEARPGQDVSAPHCNACGRACGCDGYPSAPSDNVVLPTGRSQGPPTSRRAESSWTGM